MYFSARIKNSRRSIYSKILVAIVLFIAITTIFLLHKTRTTKPVVKPFASLISREEIFEDPIHSGVRLSPDGQYISFIAAYNHVPNIWIAPRDNPQNATVITQSEDSDILSYAWAYTNKHIVFAKDDHGDENWVIYVVDIDTKKVRALTPASNIQAQVQQLSPDQPTKVLFQLGDLYDGPKSIVKIDILTGQTETLITNKKHFDSFVTDNANNVRFGRLESQDGGYDLIPINHGVVSKEIFLHIPLDDETSSSPIEFDRTNQYLFLKDSRGQNTTALVSIDTKTGVKKILATDSNADADDVIFNPQSKIPEAVSFTFDKQKLVALNPNANKDIENLKQAHFGEIFITDTSLDGRFWTVAYSAPQIPDVYYLYDRKVKSSKFLFPAFQFSNKNLSPTYPLITTSSDGVKLLSYLTIPSWEDNDGKPRRPLPMVVFAHGGPWIRDRWEYDPEVQWLANRGYLVLQTNFRGSTGLGKNLVNLANFQWGGKMQTDLVDSANQMVLQDFADPGRIAIMGYSFGGFASLSLLTTHPTFFAAGIDFSGPSDLTTMLENPECYCLTHTKVYEKRVGNYKLPQDKKMLQEQSPLFHADSIVKPLLVIHGDNDPRVLKNQSDRIVNSLVQRNIPVTYLVFEDEGHGLSEENDNLAFYASVEKFLQKHLGGRMEPVDPEIISDSNLKIPVGKKYLYPENGN